MSKTLKSLPRKRREKASSIDAKSVRDSETGKSVTVKGIGALKGDYPKIKRGVSLLKPIAAQTLTERSEKRKAG